jgi:hypothetical protein
MACTATQTVRNVIVSRVLLRRSTATPTTPATSTRGGVLAVEYSWWQSPTGQPEIASMPKGGASRNDRFLGMRVPVREIDLSWT